MPSILVLGSGPGGYVAAIRAAQLGADVTLVERAALGGTCLNAGCIPTKAILHTARLLDEARSGSAFGVDAEPRLNFPKAMARKNAIVRQLAAGVTGLLKANRVRVLRGTAAFVGEKEVEIAAPEGEVLRPAADAVVIAVGAVPAMPPIPGVDSPGCLDSTGILSLETVPPRLAVVGGGVVGVEMATAFSSLGSKVTVIEILDEILPMMDRELTRTVRNKMLKRGVEFLLGARVLSITPGADALEVAVDHRGDGKTVLAETVLVAAGRRPDTEALGLDRAGIATERGRIVTNERQETNVPGVYAVGDCTGGMMLAHVASVQGEVAAENALGGDSVTDLKTSPSCVYTSPEFAGVGLTEEEATARGVSYRVGKFPLLANGKTLIMGGEGMIKVLAAPEDGRILGVHIVGPRATDLIAEGALAVGLGTTAEQLVEVIHAHPTVGEAVREAALAFLGRAIHIPNK